MKDSCEGCPHERVHRVEYQALTASLGDLKDRVTRLETTLGRGVMLLVANLVGMVVSLAHNFLHG